MLKICGAYFSPTGTTRKVVQTLVQSIANHTPSQVRWLDFTLPAGRIKPLAFEPDELVILGLPVYAGRVPNLLLPYLEQMTGTGAKAIAVSVYGNRHYDDAVQETVSLLSQAGLAVVAAGAFVAEHSFSTVLAKGRPDEADLKVIQTFGQAVCQALNQATPKLSGLDQPLTYYQPKVDGKPVDIRPVKPVTNPNRCTDCKICVGLCPLGSIDYQDVSQVGKCMKCCACIKGCPEGAKAFDDDKVVGHTRDLEEKYANRRSPEYWIGEELKNIFPQGI